MIIYNIIKNVVVMIIVDIDLIIVLLLVFRAYFWRCAHPVFSFFPPSWRPEQIITYPCAANCSKAVEIKDTPVQHLRQRQLAFAKCCRHPLIWQTNNQNNILTHVQKLVVYSCRCLYIFILCVCVSCFVWFCTHTYVNVVYLPISLYILYDIHIHTRIFGRASCGLDSLYK